MVTQAAQLGASTVSQISILQLDGIALKCTGISTGASKQQARVM